ncbi:Os12g0177900 [Oryza sativa Japonica Group]|uniref:Os12g0177900 protein n=2 Tax=Oryza TaxID=4527 RepID=A0A0P0Y7M6_ORYSJ|nr:hypothetical protein EE612_058139 [Oryza sativa]BAT16120.1 Os12g0177900 [Oryza sativa Japonica Group]
MAAARSVGMEAEVAALRGRFAAGGTRGAEWRAAQLRGILRMAAEAEAEVCRALHADLAKPYTESYVHEANPISPFFLFFLPIK